MWSDFAPIGHRRDAAPTKKQNIFTAEDAEDAEVLQVIINETTGVIVDSGMKVHSTLGPGLLEGAYEACLAYELRKRGLEVLVQHPLPIQYDGVLIDVGYRVDLLVNETVIVELKAIAKVLPVHEAQLLSYLKLSGHKVGLLINFNVRYLKEGIRRMVNNI